MIEWETTAGLIPLQDAIARMEERVANIHNKLEKQLIWMVEHPHIYSGGTSSKESHILSSIRIPIKLTNRGGAYTYHGPGQRVVYVMLDLKRQGKDIRRFVWNLEQWVINTLEDFGIAGERREERIGIWVSTPKRNRGQPEDLKIASVGLRVKNWISYFGVSINVNPNLKYFDDIISCGNPGYGVTSLEHQGSKASLTELDTVLKQKFRLSFSEGQC